MRGRHHGLALALVLLWAAMHARSAHAGAYIFALENDPAIITHPTGYTGTGGTLNVSVCIDQTSQHASEMEYPVQQAIAQWNARTPKLDNIRLMSDNDIPSGFDFESVVLHEIGHCVGLDHPNSAGESGLPASQTDSTKAQENTGGLEVGAGVDGVYGSADDVRGDDINLHWFEKGVNDPFTLPSVVDSDTFSRFLADLPVGHLFAANGNRDVAALQSLPPSEAVMNQGGSPKEAQRCLGHDDIATLQLAEAGLDEDAGTSDDYTLVLTYAGLADPSTCDIAIDFDASKASMALCNTVGFFIGATDHIEITEARIWFSPNVIWYFNRCGDGILDVPPFGHDENCDDGNRNDGDGCSHTCRIEAGSVCTGEPSICLLPAVPLASGALGSFAWLSSLAVLLGVASSAILWSRRSPLSAE